ncbi:MAG: hypothetical protein P8Y36_12770 [Alphaproteobacteria bacterium]
MPTADDFRRELEARFQQALEIGAPHIDVVSGDLHRAVGGYPTPKHRMPNCCSVMNQEFDPDCDEILSEKVSHGARLAYRYKLPRNESRASKRGFGARVEERREQANGPTMRPADQSTVYNFNIERSVIGANGNTVIADNVGNVSQTATINIGQCLQDIDGLKSQLNWAGSERHQQIIQQLTAIQEHLVGGRTAEAKSTWQSVGKQIGAISGAANNVWDLFGRISQLLT